MTPELDNMLREDVTGVELGSFVAWEKWEAALMVFLRAIG